MSVVSGEVVKKVLTLLSKPFTFRFHLTVAL